MTALPLSQRRMLSPMLPDAATLAMVRRTKLGGLPLRPRPQTTPPQPYGVCTLESAPEPSKRPFSDADAGADSGLPFGSVLPLRGGGYDAAGWASLSSVVVRGGLLSR
jgi:hypothetical protein